jgi:hypothetical protein
MKVRLTSLALLLGLAAAFVFAPLSSNAAPKPPVAQDGFVTAVAGTARAADGTITAFTGTATLLDFVNKNGVLSVVFSLTSATGQALGTFTAPVAVTSGAACDILFLDIG